MQTIVVALIVSAAVAYLLWKMLARPRRIKRGPDVPIGRLVKRKGRDESGHAS